MLGRSSAFSLASRCGASGIGRSCSSVALASEFVALGLAQKKKLSEVDIMRVTGHRSTTILRGYVRRATLREDAPRTTILG